MAYFKKHPFLCVTTVKQQNKKHGSIQNAQKWAPLLYIEDNIFILVYNIFKVVRTDLLIYNKYISSEHENVYRMTDGTMESAQNDSNCSKKFLRGNQKFKSAQNEERMKKKNVN